ncbi:MAG TPA: OB-fold nucleic acid binding domain-containing protein [candidate division Zixibacteria bacterium]|nr:OB-fold nucleic acid binding domain-containing protein [candidate division Zixibacteria bacterium]
MEKKIKEYSPDDHVTGYFAVRRKAVREYARGRFVTFELGDSSGRINAVMWEPDKTALEDAEEGMVVKARGTVGEYQGRPQLLLEKIRLAKDSEYQLDDIMPHSPNPIEDRRGRIRALADKIENSYIKQLTDLFFNDEAWFEKYLLAPAGKLWHHAYIGGLADHSANVTQLAFDVSAHYDWLDRDLLLFGGLFHDAGKIAQYSTKTVIDYTTEGRLVGHIVLIDQWICKKAEEIEAMPPVLLAKLRHMILSHHGELEFGAAALPQIPEAFVLYYCDEIDSKMGAIDRIRTHHPEGGWSDFVKMLNRHLYFKGSESD